MNPGLSPETADFASGCAEVARLDAAPDADASVALCAWLSHRSWALRDLAVAAIGRREHAAGLLVAVLERGEWWARASACDALALRARAETVPALLRALEDRNVSLQRSALRALLAIVERCGMEAVTQAIGTLDAAARRRVLARWAHQAPHSADELAAGLANVPPAAAASTQEPEAQGDARVLQSFRRWLLGPEARVGAAR